MGMVGTLMAVSKIFDGVSDFLFGRLIDKTKTKMGKARPWMLWTYIGCAVTLVLTFSVPEKWGMTAQEYRVSFWEDENALKWIMVMAA